MTYPVGTVLTFCRFCFDGESGDGRESPRGGWGWYGVYSSGTAPRFVTGVCRTWQTLLGKNRRNPKISLRGVYVEIGPCFGRRHCSGRVRSPFGVEGPNLRRNDSTGGTSSEGPKEGGRRGRTRLKGSRSGVVRDGGSRRAPSEFLLKEDGTRPTEPVYSLSTGLGLHSFRVHPSVPEPSKTGDSGVGRSGPGRLCRVVDASVPPVLCFDP